MLWRRRKIWEAEPFALLLPLYVALLPTGEHIEVSVAWELADWQAEGDGGGGFWIKAVREEKRVVFEECTLDEGRFGGPLQMVWVSAHCHPGWISDSFSNSCLICFLQCNLVDTYISKSFSKKSSMKFAVR